MEVGRPNFFFCGDRSPRGSGIGGSFSPEARFRRGGTYLFGAPRNEHVSPPTYLSEGLAPRAPPIPVKRQNYRRRSEPRARAASPPCGRFESLFVIKSKKLSLRIERTTAASPRPTCGSRPSWEQSVDDESSTYDEPPGGAGTHHDVTFREVS